MEYEIGTRLEAIIENQATLIEQNNVILKLLGYGKEEKKEDKIVKRS